jgi:hypothetical protein
MQMDSSVVVSPDEEEADGVVTDIVDGSNAASGGGGAKKKKHRKKKPTAAAAASPTDLPTVSPWFEVQADVDLFFVNLFKCVCIYRFVKQYYVSDNRDKGIECRATRDLPPGTQVLLEPGYVFVVRSEYDLNSSPPKKIITPRSFFVLLLLILFPCSSWVRHLHQFCHFCLKRCATETAIPCSICRCHVTCGAECSAAAHMQHELECPVTI